MTTQAVIDDLKSKVQAAIDAANALVPGPDQATYDALVAQVNGLNAQVAALTSANAAQAGKIAAAKQKLSDAKAADAIEDQAHTDALAALG